MKNSLIIFFLISVVALTAQPVVDGSDAGDSDYISLASWTEGDTGFGDHGVVELKAYANSTDLFIILLGECESNLNDLYIFINQSTSTNGVSAGSQLPAASDNLSPLYVFRPTLDFECDFGLRLTADGSQAYVSIVDYRGGGNTDTFLATIANDGTATTISSGTYNGTVIAYEDMGSLTARNGDEGWELQLNLADIGASSGDTFELFALYGANDYISANTLPEIAGQGGTSLGSNPDFDGISGNQHTTASSLPVELTSFTGTLVDNAVELNWETATEVNNAGFNVECRIENGEWTTKDFIKGNGTTNSPKSYSYTDTELPDANEVSYRLKQIDNDGTFSYSKVVTVNISSVTGIEDDPKQYKFELSQNYPNPFNPTTQISFTVPETAEANLKVYDVLGNEIAEIFNDKAEAGQVYNLNFDASNFSSGVYFYKLSSQNNIQLRKMLLVK